MSDNGGDNQEVKPEGPQHVALKLQGSGFPELVIKVKKSTKLAKMMNAYCDRAGKALNEVRFMYEGTRLKPEMFVHELDIDDVEADEEIVIDVAQEAMASLSVRSAAFPVKVGWACGPSPALASLQIAQTTHAPGLDEMLQYASVPDEPKVSATAAVVTLR
ncbi:hypothetical protein JCM10908_001795 [Rhodotorula pacifica]|uniref:uncharacterized protein n=1 Tax=Rhodotorula pacifica TaxID=1495444 RepID=UPI0031776246